MKIIALIVTHNRLSKLKITICKTLKQDFASVVVVNCGSTDGSVDYLNSIDDSRLRLLHVDNIGGAGGFRQGSEFIVNNLSCDWVVFYDDDAFPDDYLVENFNSIETANVDLISAHVKSQTQLLPQMNLPVKRYPNTVTRMKEYLLNRSSCLIGEDDLTNLQGSKIEAASFVGFFVRFEVLCQYYQSIKSELFIYFDDLYFSHFLAQKGYCFLFYPQLKFLHDVEESDSVPPWKLYYHSKNMFVMGRLITRPAMKVFILMKSVSAYYMALRCQSKISALKLVSIGLWDGINDRHDRFGNVDPVARIIKEFK